MIKIPANVVEFSGGTAHVGVYKQFVDYWNHYNNKGEFATSTIDTEGNTVSLSFDEKEDALNKAIKREALRLAGITMSADFPEETWANHPTLQWAIFGIVGNMVDMILPDSIIQSNGLYSEVRNIGWGDTAAFDVSPRDLFVVTKGGRANRTSEIHKQSRGQVVINPENHMLTVGVSLYRVLAGKESLAEFVAKVIQSFEVAFTYEVYDAMATAMAALSTSGTTQLKYAGYSDANFVGLAQKVSAWNGGAKAVAIGTQLAIAKIFPSVGASQFRYTVDDDYFKLGYVRNYQGVDIMVLPQVADYATPYSLKLKDDRVWFVSPSSQKIVKAVLEGSVQSNTNDTYGNANLTQNTTMTKSWGIGIATNAVAGELTV